MGQLMCKPSKIEQKLEKESLKKKQIQKECYPSLNTKLKTNIEDKSKNQFGDDITFLLYDISNTDQKPIKIKYFQTKFGLKELLIQVQILFPKSQAYYINENKLVTLLNQEKQYIDIVDVLKNTDFLQPDGQKCACPCLYINKVEKNKINENEIIKKIQELRVYLKEKQSKKKDG